MTEIQQVAEWMITHSYATGHGDTIADMLVELEGQAKERAQKSHRPLVIAVRWFADKSNWREEELSEGTHFSAEWLIGFDPRDIAQRALKIAGEA